MEDKDEIEAQKESIVEVKKDIKKKEGLKDLLNVKKSYNNKKYQKNKYNNRENKNKNNYEKYNNNYKDYKNNDKTNIGKVKHFYSSKVVNINNNIYNSYKNDYKDYSGYNNFNTFRDSNYNYKHNFVNSTKKNINNDSYIDISKDKKYNYGYSNYGRQYSQANYSSGEFQTKKFFGKINFSNNDQYSVKRPYNYIGKENKEKDESNEKTDNSSKKLFYNSKIDNSKEENLKNLDTKEDLFIGKFMKYTSSSSIGFNSSNENSLKNLPFVQNTQQNNNINKEEENINNDDREENKDINKNNTKNTDEIDTENKDIEKDLNFNEKNLKEEEETNNNEDNKHIKEEQKENNDNNLNNNEESRNEDNKGKELEIEIIKTKKYTSTNYNDYSIPYYKKNTYYNNSKRKRYGSYHPKNIQKLINSQRGMMTILILL